MEHPESRGRRRVLHWFLGTSVGALCLSIAYPVIRYLTPPSGQRARHERGGGRLTNDPAFVEKGYVITRFGAVARDRDPGVADRLSRLLGGVHTPRLHRRVQERQDLIWCNCHNGRYNLQGEVVGGPPPKPLSPSACTWSRSRAAAQTVVVSRRAA